jgi:TolB-like protein/Tfp pilus assembly protein PilF
MTDNAHASDQLSVLSQRERMVAAKFADGMTYREIGEALFIAPSTVRTHLSAIYQKLGVSSKVGLAKLFSEERAGSLSDASHPIQARDGAPLVAILPFDSLSPEARWERLADGIWLDVITGLARYSHIMVAAPQATRPFKGEHSDLRAIGRELEASYVIEGSVQASDSQVRVWVQLVDVGSGASLWAERYDRPAQDLFAIQDAVTNSVVNVLGGCYGRFIQVRRDAARRKPPSGVGAYDCYLLGVEQLDLDTRASTEEAVRLLSRAVELDPNFARAWSRLAFAYHSQAYNAYGADPWLSLDRCIACTEKALSLDPEDAAVRHGSGCLRAWKGDIKGAAEENSRLVSNAPNDSMTLALVAECRALVAGDPEEACSLIERAIDLNRNAAPQWYFGTLAVTRFVTGRYADSVEAMRLGTANTPCHLMFHAMASAMAGETSDAAASAARLASEFPAFTVDGFVRRYPVVNPPALSAFAEGARRAGLPLSAQG